MYNLIEYSDIYSIKLCIGIIYSKISGSLLQYCREKPALNMAKIKKKISYKISPDLNWPEKWF